MTDQSTVSDDDLGEYRARVRHWLATVEVPRSSPDRTLGDTPARTWQRTLSRAGLTGVDWPTRDGGQGLTAAHQRAVVVELARARAPMVPGLLGLESVGPTISRYGTERQRARFLPRLLTGHDVWSLGFAEPDAGSDLAALRTRAVPTGNDLVVTGHKVWAPHVGSADWCAVLARTCSAISGEAGISYLLVDLHAPGVTLRRTAHIAGRAEYGDVLLDAVRVPRANVLGAPGEGWAPAIDTLRHANTSHVARRGIELAQLFATSVAAMRQRGAGGPDTATAEAIGRCQHRIRGLQALSDEAIRRLQDGRGSAAFDAVEKLALTSVEQLLSGTLLDLLGSHRTASCGSGYPDGEELVAGYFEGRASAVRGGTSECQRTVVAEGLLGLPAGA